MQAHGELSLAGVGNPVETKLVTHVCDLVLSVGNVPLDLQRSGLQRRRTGRACVFWAGTVALQLLLRMSTCSRVVRALARPAV